MQHGEEHRCGQLVDLRISRFHYTYSSPSSHPFFAVFFCLGNVTPSLKYHHIYSIALFPPARTVLNLSSPQPSSPQLAHAKQAKKNLGKDKLFFSFHGETPAFFACFDDELLSDFFFFFPVFVHKRAEEFNELDISIEGGTRTIRCPKEFTTVHLHD